MQAEINIAFDQLVQLAKQLPATQWKQLKQEVEEPKLNNKEREDFKQLLLNGPVFSEKQLKTIANTRKKINQWRTK